MLIGIFFGLDDCDLFVNRKDMSKFPFIIQEVSYNVKP